MPDALETARALDEEFARTGRLKGPLHGIVFAIKDQFDTFDMRSTSGAAADYANDRPPRDAEIVARLRAAGAIILAKANMGEYAAGDRSTFGGTTCNPYDTTRSAGRSSGGSGAAVAANLVTCAIGEETGPSARNPAANGSLVGIVATHSLVSRAGLIPASLTRDRAGMLCRTVKDAATVLAARRRLRPARSRDRGERGSGAATLRTMPTQRASLAFGSASCASSCGSTPRPTRTPSPSSRTPCAISPKPARRWSIPARKARCSRTRSPKSCPRSMPARWPRCSRKRFRRAPISSRRALRSPAMPRSCRPISRSASSPSASRRPRARCCSCSTAICASAATRTSAASPI